MSAVTPLAIFDLFSDREDRSCSFDLGFTVVANSIARALQQLCNRFATALQERCNSFARSLQVLRLCWTRLQVLCKVLRLLSTPLQVHLQGLCKCYACVGLDCNFYAHRRLDLPSEKIQEEMNVATRNLRYFSRITRIALAPLTLVYSFAASFVSCLSLSCHRRRNRLIVTCYCRFPCSRVSF